jgi:hypothetical protein
MVTTIGYGVVVAGVGLTILTVVDQLGSILPK